MSREEREERRERRAVRRERSSFFWTYLLGIGLIVLGAIILFDRLYIVSFKHIIRTYWPVILIIAGVLMVLKRYTYEPVEREIKSEPDSGGEGEKETERTYNSTYESDSNLSNLFGDVKYSGTTQDYPGGSISNIFGDIYIDLTQIDISAGKKVLNVSGIFGSIKIKLPPGMPARFYGSSIAGAIKFLDEKRDGLLISLSSSTTDYDTAEKKLDIKTSLIFGDITVK